MLADTALLVVCVCWYAARFGIDFVRRTANWLAVQLLAYVRCIFNVCWFSCAFSFHCAFCYYVVECNFCLKCSFTVCAPNWSCRCKYCFRFADVVNVICIASRCVWFSMSRFHLFVRVMWFPVLFGLFFALHTVAWSFTIMMDECVLHCYNALVVSDWHDAFL